jgi:hypothetical protein
MRTSFWIDAICWENPLFYGPHLEWCNAVIHRLKELEKGKATRIMLLFEEGRNFESVFEIANNYIKDKNWMISLAGLDYTAIPKNTSPKKI